MNFTWFSVSRLLSSFWLCFVLACGHLQFSVISHGPTWHLLGQVWSNLCFRGGLALFLRHSPSGLSFGCPDDHQGLGTLAAQNLKAFSPCRSPVGHLADGFSGAVCLEHVFHIFRGFFLGSSLSSRTLPHNSPNLWVSSYLSETWIPAPTVHSVPPGRMLGRQHGSPHLCPSFQGRVLVGVGSIWK